jgi:hypothetical protein
MKDGKKEAKKLGLIIDRMLPLSPTNKPNKMQTTMPSKK